MPSVDSRRSQEQMDICCTANSHFALANMDVSDKMLEQIVLRAYDMGAQFITSTDIECLQHIDAYLQPLDLNLEVIHIADILNSDFYP